jgi:hypothetical protein
MAVIYRTADKAAPGTDKRADFPTPLVMREINEYRSPIDGKLITSRTERNEDCKRNDAIPWEPGIGSKAGADKRAPGLYKNPKFAAKRGLPLAPEVREKLENKG